MLLPSFRVFMYSFAKFKFFRQYFIIFIKEKVRQLLTSLVDKKKHLFLCPLQNLVKCSRTEDLVHSLLLNPCQFLFLHTNPKFHITSSQRLPLLKKCKHPNQIDHRPSNCVKPKMPFCRPCYWSNLQS